MPDFHLLALVFFQLPPKLLKELSASRILIHLHVFIGFAFLLPGTHRALLFPAWILFIATEKMQTRSGVTPPLLANAVPWRVLGCCLLSGWLPRSPPGGRVPVFCVFLGLEFSSVFECTLKKNVKPSSW